MIAVKMWRDDCRVILIQAEQCATINLIIVQGKGIARNPRFGAGRINLAIKQLTIGTNSELGAAKQKVGSRTGPFRLHKVVNFVFMQAIAQILTEIAKRSDII